MLKVLIVSSEVSPYAKSGGLGEVAGSLPAALKKQGVDARVVFPKYKNVNCNNLTNLKYLDSFTVNLSWRRQSASVYSFDGISGDGVTTMYMIENDYYFGRDGYYGYSDDYERFAFFSKAALEFLIKVDFKPDIIHFNDWQTGLGPVYLKDMYKGFVFYSDIKSIFTIHNLQYQGVFGREVLSSLDLNDGYYTGGQLEFYHNISFMKAGLLYADAITTVSEAYAREIQTPHFAYGMDGILRSREQDLYGILNGIDTIKYDPMTDKYLYAHFNKNDLSGKQENKRRLQERLGLPQTNVPVVSIISRLVDQKGIDLVAVAIEEILSKDLQLVVLGIGDGRYENMFKHYAYHYPHKLSANITFDDDIAQKIYSGSDIFLMPSLFEPCGLGQLYAMRYGTVPVVRNTGGLADTVQHFDNATLTGNGFVFNDYLASGMMWALNEALRTFHNQDEWHSLVENCMDCDFSWDASAKKYKALYEKLI